MMNVAHRSLQWKIIDLFSVHNFLTCVRQNHAVSQKRQCTTIKHHNNQLPVGAAVVVVGNVVVVVVDVAGVGEAEGC